MPNEKPLSQRHLALQLRAAIDVARRSGARDATDRVRELIEANPTASRSSHVKHNLGVRRWRWLWVVLLETMSMKPNKDLQKNAGPGERAIRADITQPDLRGQGTSDPEEREEVREDKEMERHERESADTRANVE